MRHSPELIARVIGQMDSDDENVRLVAFGKAHAMLKAAGLKFADLHAAHVTAASRPTANDTKPAANTTTTEQPRPRKPTTADIPEPGAYLHDPQVGFWKRSVRGKRVIANQAPPNGVAAGRQGRQPCGLTTGVRCAARPARANRSSARQTRSRPR